MKRLSLLVPLCFAFVSCRSAEHHDITVWRIPKTEGLAIEIGYTAISVDTLDRVMMKAATKDRDVGLIVCLPTGVSITNAFALLEMAEKYGITNSAVRINQIRPPYVLQPGDRGFIHEMIRE